METINRTATGASALFRDAKGSLDPAQIEVLTEICAAEILDAFGVEDSRRDAAFLGGAARFAARRIAYKAAVYDEIVGGAGLKSGGVWAVSHLARSLDLVGVENVPEDGPLLIVSNHPGLSDTVALFAAIPRDDLNIMAAERPFLAALPNTSSRLLTVDEASKERFGLIRRAARHMKKGGALLTFPGGGIEPDPALLPGAAESLGGWSESLDLFVRLVPDLTVVPAIVSGVLSRRALRNPLTLVRESDEDRRWLAATIQMISPIFHKTDVRVEFGEAIHTSEEAPSGETSAAVLHAARRLISRAT